MDILHLRAMLSFYNPMRGLRSDLDQPHSQCPTVRLPQWPAQL